MSLAPTHLMDQLVDVYRPGPTAKDDGGYPNTGNFSVNLSNIMAAIRPGPGSETFGDDRIRTTQTITFYVEPGQDILSTDLIKWGADYYEITGPVINNAVQGRFLRIDGQKLEGVNYAGQLA